MKTRFTLSCIVVLASSLMFGAASYAFEDNKQNGEKSVGVDLSGMYQVDSDNLFIFETSKGKIYIQAFPEIAPSHVTQIRSIIRSGKYDGTPFHRVIDDFMAQGGDITLVDPAGSGLPNIDGEFTFRRDPKIMPLTLVGKDSLTGFYQGLPIETQSEYLAEMTEDGKVESWVPHCKGITSMARTSDPNSANSQFFLMRAQSEWLDKKYSAWGRILSGQDVVDALKTGEPVSSPDILVKAVVAADLPEDKMVTAHIEADDSETRKARYALYAEDTKAACAIGLAPAIIKDTRVVD